MTEASSVPDASEMSAVKLLCHLWNPSNLLNWMIFTAWVKLMGLASYLPTVTVG